MTKIIPPQLAHILKETALCSLLMFITIALSRYGTDPASRFLRAYLTFLFLTPYGWTTLTLVTAYSLIRWLSSRRRG
jgi:hypothetical protein